MKFLTTFGKNWSMHKNFFLIAFVIYLLMLFTEFFIGSGDSVLYEELSKGKEVGWRSFYSFIFYTTLIASVFEFWWMSLLILGFILAGLYFRKKELAVSNSLITEIYPSTVHYSKKLVVFDFIFDVIYVVCSYPLSYILIWNIYDCYGTMGGGELCGISWGWLLIFPLFMLWFIVTVLFLFVFGRLKRARENNPPQNVILLIYYVTIVTVLIPIIFTFIPTFWIHNIILKIF